MFRCKAPDAEENDDEHDSVQDLKQCALCKEFVKDLVNHTNTCEYENDSRRNGSSMLKNSAMSSVEYDRTLCSNHGNISRFDSKQEIHYQLAGK